MCKPDKNFFKDGISSAMINSLATELRKKFGNVRVMIRLTNPGSLLGLEHKYALGKPLWAKAKSSNSFFAAANLTACPLLAKSFKGTSKSAEEVEIKLLETLKKGSADCSLVNKFIPTYDPASLVQTCILKGFAQAQSKSGVEVRVRNDTTEEYVWANNTKQTGFIRNIILSGQHKGKVRGPKPEFLLVNYKDAKPLFTENNVSKSVLEQNFFRKKMGFNFQIRHLFQVFVSIESLGDFWKNNLPTWHVELKDSEKRYYPVQVLAEKWKKAWYEIVADYDLFAVCPGMNIVNKHNDIDFFLPRKYLTTYKNLKKEKVEAYDLKFDKKDEDLGILSQFENEVRKTINTTLGIPVARHGCETLNLFYTSDLEAVNNVIQIDTTATSKPGSRIEYVQYLKLAGTNNSRGNFFVPLNPAWCKKSFGQKTEDFCNLLMKSINATNKKVKKIDKAKLLLLIDYYKSVDNYAKINNEMELILGDFLDIKNYIPKEQ